MTFPRSRGAAHFAAEMWSGAVSSAERARAGMERHPELGTAALILAVLLAGLLTLVIRAAVRSARRHQAAGLRDDLVDAVRMGEIDISDLRVYAMIDFCDRVAQLGRRPRAGRHASSRPVLDSALAASLISAVGPGSLLPPGGPFWPSPGPGPAEVEISDVWVRAVDFHRRLVGRNVDETFDPATIPDCAQIPDPGPARRALVSIPTGELPVVDDYADPNTGIPPTRAVPVLAGPPTPDIEASEAHSPLVSRTPQGLDPNPTPGVQVCLPQPQSQKPDLTTAAQVVGPAPVVEETEQQATVVEDRQAAAPDQDSFAALQQEEDALSWDPRAAPQDRDAALQSRDVALRDPDAVPTDTHRAQDPEAAPTTGLPVPTAGADDEDPAARRDPYPDTPTTPIPVAMAHSPVAPQVDDTLAAVLHRGVLVRLEPDAPVFDEVVRALGAMAWAPRTAPGSGRIPVAPGPCSPALGIAGLLPARLGPLPRSGNVGAVAATTGPRSTAVEVAAAEVAAAADPSLAAHPAAPVPDPLTDPFFTPHPDGQDELEPVFLAASAAQRAAEQAAREQAVRDREREAEEQALREGVALRWAALRQVARERADAAAEPLAASVPVASPAMNSEPTRAIDLRPLEEPRPVVAGSAVQIDLTAVEAPVPMPRRPPAGPTAGGAEPQVCGPDRAGPYLSPYPDPYAVARPDGAGELTAGPLPGPRTSGGGVGGGPARGRHRRDMPSTPSTNPIGARDTGSGAGALVQPFGTVSDDPEPVATGSVTGSGLVESAEGRPVEGDPGEGPQAGDALGEVLPEEHLLGADPVGEDPGTEEFSGDAPPVGDELVGDELIGIEPVGDEPVGDTWGTDAQDEDAGALEAVTEEAPVDRWPDAARSGGAQAAAPRPRWMSPADASARGGLWGRRPRGAYTSVTGHGKPADALVPFTEPLPVRGDPSEPQEAAAREQGGRSDRPRPAATGSDR